jgi:hypothetical protein
MRRKSVKVAPGENVFSVVWPLGRPAREIVTLNPRPSDLDGRTIGFISDYKGKHHEVFQTVRQSLRQAFPNITLVDYPAFGDIHGKDERGVFAALPGRLRAEGVDAVIAGIGV